MYNYKKTSYHCIFFILSNIPLYDISKISTHPFWYLRVCGWFLADVIHFSVTHVVVPFPLKHIHSGTMLRVSTLWLSVCPVRVRWLYTSRDKRVFIGNKEIRQSNPEVFIACIKTKWKKEIKIKLKIIMLMIAIQMF